MAILADYHLHSSFSGDSTTPMEEMIQKGIAIGLRSMCFTEHNDFDYPADEDMPEDSYLLNTDAYLYDLLRFRDKYNDKINLYFGVELGLQPHLAKRNSAYAKSFDFDFIIASSHVCDFRDPYNPSYFEGRSEEEAYRDYFSSIIENIKKFTDFDVYGHLDYVLRYGPNLDKYYTYDKYKDLFDTMLTLLIEKGKGIEVNTGGVKKGLRELHPCTDVIRRYHELGGEIITTGSDAHEPTHIADAFDKAAEVLKSCGFRYYTVFSGRNPDFIKI